MVEILQGDCRELLPALGTFDFIFADPPFGIGQSYDGYEDKPDSTLIREAVAVCWESCDGTLALHGPDDLAEEYLQIARQLGMRRIAWVNWHYRFGQCRWTNWVDSRCHCLVFAKHDVHTWNPDDVSVESDRATKYNDKRIHDTLRGGRHPARTVWGIPSDGEYWGRVTGNSAERRPGHPNQLPERYLERLIRAYTNPGDWVLDPFCGSGTTAVVAHALRRDCITIDISAENVASAEERLSKGAVRVKWGKRGT